jgi:hypothetical protein
MFLLRQLATPTVSISCRYRKFGGSSGSRIEYSLLAARAAQPSSPQTRLVCWSVLLDPQLALSSQLLLPSALRYHVNLVASRGPPEASSSNRIASPSATTPSRLTARRPTLALVSLESSASAPLHPTLSLPRPEWRSIPSRSMVSLRQNASLQVGSQTDRRPCSALMTASDPPGVHDPGVRAFRPLLSFHSSRLWLTLSRLSLYAEGLLSS